ncbi:MAG: type IIL restriction-modification enzyme MmeI, partial [Chloroflexales bacterium]
MPTPAEVQQFIQHWERVTLNEKAVAQSHFNALCTLLGLKGPVEADPTGQFFRFEKPLTKSGGTAGFADVWYKGRFAVEYKTKGKYATLYEAYSQLELYKDDLANPPVLMACDIARYEVHIVFTGYSTRIHKFTNRDLENASIRELLRLAFTNPEALRPVEPAETVTKHIAGRFARIAELLEGRGFAPAEIAHFFMKVLFALFAEDIRLLPAELMSKSIRRAILNPEEFPDRARALFRAMREGGYFGEDRVPRFNGWLFDDDEVLPLNADELALLEAAARHDWQEVEPGIFGTLFERGLDRAKRAQLGAHYTSREDILLIVEPVLMRPLRREWENVKDGVAALRNQWEPLTGNAQRRIKSIAE